MDFQRHNYEYKRFLIIAIMCIINSNAKHNNQYQRPTGPYLCNPYIKPGRSLLSAKKDL